MAVYNLSLLILILYLSYNFRIIMHDGNPFIIISVTGAHSGVGKTTLCAMLLKEFNGFGAVKFTRTPMYTSLIDDEEVLKQNGKDTAIMYEAGAEKVLWVKSPGEDELGLVLGEALQRMKGLNGVVVEGNSPVDFLNPHLVIFIIAKDGKVKPSALKVAGRADVLVFNSDRKLEPAGLPVSLREDIRVFRIDLIEKKGEFDGLISFIKDRIS